MSVPSNLNLSSFSSITSGVPGGNLSNLQSSIPTTGSIDEKLNKNKEQIEKLGSLQNNNPLKNFQGVNPNDFLKDQEQLSKTAVTNALTNLVLPILMKFINTEKVANVIINKLINDTKRKLKGKGRVEVIDGTIIFTPRNSEDYTRFKDNFDKRVSRLKITVNVLRDTINTLTSVLQIVQTALAALQIYLSLKKKLLLFKAAGASANLNIPQISYPSAGDYIVSKETNDQIIKQLEDKINQYALMISFINNILGIFKKALNDLKIKLEKLQFNINTNNPSTIENNPTSIAASLTRELDETEAEDEKTTEDYDNKNYTISVETTPSGAIQAVAYDKFSRMKITATAPSKLRSATELINELKQILG